MVEDKLILELKSVDSLQRIHEAQILTYMKLAHIKTGLLINFNARLLKNMPLNNTQFHHVGWALPTIKA